MTNASLAHVGEGKEKLELGNGKIPVSFSVGGREDCSRPEVE